MKSAFLILALAAPLAAQPGFDFRSLDKLGANSKNSVNVALNQSMLRLAANFIGNDKDAASVKNMIRNLKGVYVRTYEFDKAGQYNQADLLPLRNFLRQPQWSRIVEAKGVDDNSEVFVQSLPNDQLGGVAIIAMAAKEVTVVYIEGVMNMDDVGKLGGNLGIPKLNLPRELK